MIQSKMEYSEEQFAEANRVHENEITKLHSEKEKYRKRNKGKFNELKKTIDEKIIAFNKKHYLPRNQFNFRFMSEESAAECADRIYRERPSSFKLITGQGIHPKSEQAIKKRFLRMFRNNPNPIWRRYSEKYVQCTIRVDPENTGVLILECMPHKASRHEVEDAEEFYRDTF